MFDATFAYTWQDAQSSKPSLSHYYVNEGNFLNKARPTDWTAPVDYRNGKLHVRTEVFEKPPGDQQVGWTLCYIPTSGGYGCADTTYYKSTGVFDRETEMTDFWQNEQLDWDQGIKQMDLIYAIDDSGSGHITNHPDVKDLVTPTRVRITMIQVSAGATYDPSMFSGAAGSGAAGAGGGGVGGDGLGGAGGLLGGGAGGASGGVGGLLGASGSAAVGGAGGAGAGGAPVLTSGGAAGSAPVANGGNSPSSTATTNAPTAAGCALASRSTSTSAGLWLVGLAAWTLSRRRDRRAAS